MVRIINSPLTPQPIVEKRSIATLGAVGADRSAVAIIGRQDGIIANLPADGFISADEINASLQSPHVDLLSSTEVNALRGAASLLEVRLQQPTLQPFVPVSPLESFVSARSVEPQRYPRPTFDPALPVPIDTPTALGAHGVTAHLFKDRVLLERVQRVANNDTDPTTASINDMRQALVTHGSSFTRAEVDTIGQMIADAEKYLQGQAEYAARNHRPVTPGVGSRVDLRSAETSTQVLARMGQVRVTFESTTTATVGAGADTDTVTVARTRSHHLQVPDGHMCVVNAGVSSDGELIESRPVVLGPGRHPIEHERFEVQTWRNGAIVRTDKLDLRESFEAPAADQARANAVAGGPLDRYRALDASSVGGLRGFRIFVDGAEVPTTYNRLGLEASVREAGRFTVISQGDEGPTHIEIPGLGRLLMDNLDDGPIRQLGVAVDLPPDLRSSMPRDSRNCDVDVPATGKVELALRQDGFLYVRNERGYWTQLAMKQVGG